MFDWFTGSALQISILIGGFLLGAFTTICLVYGGTRKTPQEQAEEDAEQLLALGRNHMRAGSAWGKEL